MKEFILNTIYRNCFRVYLYLAVVIEMYFTFIQLGKCTIYYIGLALWEYLDLLLCKVPWTLLKVTLKWILAHKVKKSVLCSSVAFLSDEHMMMITPSFLWFLVTTEIVTFSCSCGPVFLSIWSSTLSTVNQLTVSNTWLCSVSLQK